MFYCHVTSFHHTNLLLILIWPHSTILKYCWFSWYLIPPYWCVIDSHVTSFQHTDVCYWFLCGLFPAYWRIVHVTSFQHTNMLLILVSPYSCIICYCRFSSDLKYCWFSSDFILASQCVIDSHVISCQHTNVLLILMVSHSSILISYWF